MKSLLAYVRVSTTEQARNGVSIEMQVDRITAYSKVYDLEIVDVIREEGLSGKDMNRPGLSSAIERVRTGEADGLIVYALDRLSRNTRDFLNILQEFRGLKKEFVSIREQMDSSTPTGRFTMTILAAMAEMERELISERCREASARCFREKRAYGKTPYGFRRDGKQLIENPKEYEVLMKMVALRERGVPLYKIANRLNSKKVPAKSGKAWYPSSVRSVLKTYAKLEEQDHIVV